MTTEMLDSTVSQLLQDKSAVEYVDARENPITTVQNSDLVFGQKHNDIDCALCPTAKRACDRAWCTAKNLEEWSEMSKTTLWRWLEKLEKARRISLVSDMKLVNVPTATGAKSTTFYNLNVLNQLAMACIDNEKLNEVSCKFSDILSEVENPLIFGSSTITNRKRKGDSDSTSESPVVIQRWALDDKNNLHNIRRFFMQAEMLDTVVSSNSQELSDASASSAIKLF